MTDLRPVAPADIVPLLDVQVRDDQDDFVAPPVVTVAQARFEGGAHDFVIWDGEERVGLLAVIVVSENDNTDPTDHPDALYVWRMSVKADAQGRGHGRAAMTFAEDFARQKGRDRVQVHAVEDNAAAIGFYESLGYIRTGARSGREIQLEKML